MGHAHADLAAEKRPQPLLSSQSPGGAGSGLTDARLEDAVRHRFEAAFDTDFSTVRVHSDATAAAAANRLHAHAWAAGTHIVFGQSRYAPGTRAGDALLAHELAHVAQSRLATTASPGRRADVEADAARAAAAVTAGRPARVTVPAGPGPYRQSRDEDAPDPIANWRRSPDSVLLVNTPGRLMVLPGAGLVLEPPVSAQQLASAPAHFATDLGTLFAVPATGASATRVFRAGNRIAMIVDAGIGAGVPSAVYLDQLQGVLTSMGLTDVVDIRPIHVHKDHVSMIPEIVTRLQVPARNLVIPRAVVSGTAAIRRAVQALRNTTNPAAVALGYGASWTPGTVLRDRSGGSGGVVRHAYTIGELRVEMVALRSALANVAADPDLASYLTKVTRTTDGAKVVVLGDLRGADVETIRQAMEAHRAGSFAELFSGVTTLSGFSHHAGAMKRGDVEGIMRLLDVTLLAQGRLRVVEQTNTRTGRTQQTRSDTLELLSRLGADVVVADRPADGAGRSSASATRETVTATGFDSSQRARTSSALTRGLERIEQLKAARQTLQTWRPWFEEVVPDGSRFVNDMLAESATSLQRLRAAARSAAEAAARVRTEGVRTAAGARDYTSTGGALGTAFETALGNIPATTPAETRISPSGFDVLRRLRETPTASMPGRIALRRALRDGTYSEAAFTQMLGYFSSAEQRELIRAPMRNPAERIAGFQRVRAAYNFRRSVLGSGEYWSIPSTRGPRARRAAVGLAVFQLALELWNNVVQPLVQAHEMNAQLFRGENLLPFMRRLAFWSELNVTPRIVGIDDPAFGSLRYTTNLDTIANRLRNNPFDAVVFDRPGLEPAQVLQFGAFLSSRIRNFDEFATLFLDSGQDAIMYTTPLGGAWENATWQVRTGYYETSGTNHVVESWFTHPELTRLMRHVVPSLIANTQTLLEARRRGNGPDLQTEAHIGRLQGPGAVQRTAHLASPAGTTRVQVTTLGAGQVWDGRSSQGTLDREVTWWTPPEFFVHSVSGRYSLVSGADYNTYVVLRKLENERQTIGTSGKSLNAVYRTVTGNEEGTVWINTSLLAQTEPPRQQTPTTSPPPARTDAGVDAGRH